MTVLTMTGKCKAHYVYMYIYIYIYIAYVCATDLCTHVVETKKIFTRRRQIDLEQHASAFDAEYLMIYG